MTIFAKGVFTFCSRKPYGDLAMRLISAAGKPKAAPASRMLCRVRYVSKLATVAHRDWFQGMSHRGSPYFLKTRS